MNGGEDVIPPLDPERTKIRVNLSTAVLLSLLGVVATVAGGAAVYQGRIQQIDDRSKSNTTAISAHDAQLAELRTQLAVLNTQQTESRRLLERIDNKLDARP